MSISIELGFDASSSTALRSVWRRVEALANGHRLSESPMQPHISLALFEEEPRPHLADVVELLARATLAFDLSLSGASTFDSSEGVVYLVPGTVDALCTCHAELHAQLDRLGLKSNPLYAPGHWVPHCTVGVGVEVGFRARAISLASELAPRSVQVRLIREFHYGRAELLAERALRVR